MQLDHVGLVTRDLAQLRRQWSHFGFAPTEIRELYRLDAATGEQIPLGQRSCHTVFAQGYVELSQVTTQQAAHHLSHWQSRGPGLDILALSSAALDATHARFAETPRDGASIHLTPLADATRHIDYGLRHGDARFRWCMLNAADTPEGLVCLMQHFTADLVYQAEVQSHPNGAVSLEEILISVPLADMPAIRARYEQLLGVLPVCESNGALRFMLEQGGVILMPQDPTGTQPLTLARLAGAPHFAALVVGVKDIELAAHYLTSRGVPFTKPHDTGFTARSPQLLVNEGEAGGAHLILRQVHA